MAKFHFNANNCRQQRHKTQFLVVLSRVILMGGIQGVGGGVIVNCDLYLDKSTHKKHPKFYVCKNKRYAVIGVRN